jgi:hypothetical protein
MKKEFVNPTIQLRATIAELRKELKALRRKISYMNKKTEKTIELRVKESLEYRSRYSPF